MIPKHRTVLCVDDDPDDQIRVLETIKDIDPSLRVASALNGVDALRFLREQKARGEFPCLVILDINMPVMDGKQTLVNIKKEEGLEQVPVVLFTTSSAALDKKFAEQYGAKFVTKPIKLQEFHDTVKLLLSFCGD
jgi:CheY-like chemotaxis protein